MRLIIRSMWVVAGLTCAVSAQNFVLNPGFEDSVLPPAGGYINYSAGSMVGAWKVDYNSVDVHETGHTTAHSGNASLDLAGSGLGGSISQVLDLTPGANYRLSLWVADHWFHTDPSPFKTVEIHWGGTLVASETLSLVSTETSISWRELSYILVAPSAATELRLSTPTLNGGPIIDDVSVRFTPVPEPETWAIVTTAGLLGLVGVRSYRRRTA